MFGFRICIIQAVEGNEDTPALAPRYLHFIKWMKTRKSPKEKP
jgi:hypothetical protein